MKKIVLLSLLLLSLAAPAHSMTQGFFDDHNLAESEIFMKASNALQDLLANLSEQDQEQIQEADYLWQDNEDNLALELMESAHLNLEEAYAQVMLDRVDDLSEILAANGKEREELIQLDIERNTVEDGCNGEFTDELQYAFVDEDKFLFITLPNYPLDLVYASPDTKEMAALNNKVEGLGDSKPQVTVTFCKRVAASDYNPICSLKIGDMVLLEEATSQPERTRQIVEQELN